MLENKSFIKEFKENHRVSLQVARKHVRLVIKYYQQLDTLVFHKQLDTTLRGLVVAGLTPEDAHQIVDEELDLGGFIPNEWTNERTTSEIISNI